MTTIRDNVVRLIFSRVGPVIPISAIIAAPSSIAASIRLITQES